MCLLKAHKKKRIKKLEVRKKAHILEISEYVFTIIYSRIIVFIFVNTTFYPMEE